MLDVFFVLVHGSVLDVAHVLDPEVNSTHHRSPDVVTERQLKILSLGHTVVTDDSRLLFREESALCSFNGKSRIGESVARPQAVAAHDEERVLNVDKRTLELVFSTMTISELGIEALSYGHLDATGMTEQKRCEISDVSKILVGKVAVRPCDERVTDKLPIGRKHRFVESVEPSHLQCELMIPVSSTSEPVSQVFYLIMYGLAVLWSRNL